MPSYKKFVFESAEIEPQTRSIVLRYGFDDALHFEERISLPEDVPLTHAQSPDVTQALQALHLAGGVSYYKAFCPPAIEVQTQQLSPSQATFWNEFYTKGLGEFFYQNKIDFRGLIQFPDAAADQPLPPAAKRTPLHALVPFGGGKDSQMTVEILKQNSIDIRLFRMQGHPFITTAAEYNRLPLIEVTRTLDPQLFELNKQGVYNGHVPITGYVVFLTILTALLLGRDSIFLSNERSADYGNVEYLGMQANHQWSKSNEAELLMRGYIERYVTTSVQFLNVLRPLSELHISKLFSAFPQYFDHVTSCNRNWLWLKEHATTTKRWCGECDKCAFVFAMLAPFIPLAKLQEMFQKNLFNDKALLGRYRQLWGAEAFKPFECVGTPEETKAALYLATRNPEYAHTAIGQEFLDRILPTIPDPQQLVAQVFTPDYTDVPEYIVTMIKKVLSHEIK